MLGVAGLKQLQICLGPENQSSSAKVNVTMRHHFTVLI